MIPLKLSLQPFRKLFTAKLNCNSTKPATCKLLALIKLCKIAETTTPRQLKQQFNFKYFSLTGLYYNGAEPETLVSKLLKQQFHSFFAPKLLINITDSAVQATLFSMRQMKLCAMVSGTTQQGESVMTHGAALGT